MKKIILLLISLTFLLSSCGNKYHSHSFFAMDTFISVDAQNADDNVLRGLENLVYDDEKKFSRTFAGSGIYKFNLSGDGTVLSQDTIVLMQKAFEMYQNTDGAFSPFLGALTDLWDIKNVNPQVPTEDEINKALHHCDASDIIFSDNVVSKQNPELKLDLGGIAKGESAKNCIEYLKDRGIENAVISFGGSVACIGHSKRSDTDWNIGIKNPFETSQIIGSINVTDCYVAVSGAYERSFTQNGKRYHHIFDSKTGYPAESDIESTAVISKDGAISDGLSTALFVMGKDKALDFYSKKIYEFEAILITKNGTVIVTNGLADKFSFNENADYTDEKKLVYNGND